MKEVGIDISGNKPKMLTPDMAEKAEKMITMGCGSEAGAACPVSFIETEDWALEDPKGEIAGAGQKDTGRDKGEGK